MQIFNLLLLVLAIFYGSFAYVDGFEVPPVGVELTDQGFVAFTPEIPGVQSVMFIIKINDRRHAIHDFVDKVTSSYWASTQTVIETLHPHDVLDIEVKVLHNGKMYSRHDRFLVGHNKTVTRIDKDAVPVPLSKNDKVDSSPCDDIEMPVGQTQDCRTPVTESSPSQANCANELIFEDNFDESDYRSQWSHEVYIPHYRDKRMEFVMYDDRSSVTYLRDGYFHISPFLNPKNVSLKESVSLGGKCTKNPCEPDLCNFRRQIGQFYPPAVISARLRSKFQFKYGRIEVRAKLSKGDWLLPMVLLEPADDCGKTNKAHFRVASIKGNDAHSQYTHRGNRLNAGPVILRPGSVPSRSGQYGYLRDWKWIEDRLQPEEHFGDDFHNYTLLWKDDKFSVARDGMKFGCFKADTKYFAEKLNIVLAVSAGGMYDFKKSSNTEVNQLKMPWDVSDMKAPLQFWNSFHQSDGSQEWNLNDSTMKIDYVRVYAV